MWICAVSTSSYAPKDWALSSRHTVIMCACCSPWSGSVSLWVWLGGGFPNMSHIPHLSTLCMGQSVCRLAQ